MRISPDLEQRLKELMRMFLEENTKLNLSALRTEEKCWTGNILDSLPFLELPLAKDLVANAKLIDIGTGGGFPLLPLAIARPELRFTGIDTTGKKIKAIGRMVEQLGIKNIELMHERAEVAGVSKEHHEKYDVATARAVGSITILLGYAAPFVKTGGRIVLWKSLHIDDELKESESVQKQLDCPLEQSHEYDLGGDWGKRQLLVFKKK
jgi:16S rRNA (guanine527-N7)-methyltransferase